jgi:hypothetical protein
MGLAIDKATPNSTNQEGRLGSAKMHFSTKGFHMRNPNSFYSVFVCLILGLFVPAWAIAQNNYLAAANSEPAGSASAKGSAPTKVSIPALSCPPAGLLPVSPSAPDIGHHKVTLSWNASGSQQPRNAVGYCLYRSKSQYAAKKNPTCALCERVNAVPLASLSCIDDMVKDNTTYYYVVTAIDPERRISSPSNEITALIPSGDKSISAGLSSTAPLCRVPPRDK